MNKRCNSILFLLMLLAHLSAQVQEFKSDNYRTVLMDSLSLNFVSELDDCIVFEFTNESSDSLYLFDSYLNEVTVLLKESVCDSIKYLHRYDKEQRQCKFSFLPFLPYLSVQCTDLVVLGEDRFIRKGQILYHFSLISPKSKLSVVIPRNAFYSKKYVKDVSLKGFSIFDKGIKFENVLPPKCGRMIVEFAIYQKIDLLISADVYYLDEVSFNEQALSYEIFSISINI